MKSRIFRVFLILASLIPLASVQVAAQSSLTDIDGEEQQDKFKQRIAKARKLLFPNDELTISREKALENLRISLNTEDPDVLNEVLDENVYILLENGLVDWNEKNVLARVPSVWAAF